MPEFVYYSLENWFLCYYYPYMTISCQGLAFLMGVLYKYGVSIYCGGNSLYCPQFHPVPAVEPVGHADGGPVSARGRLHLLQGAAGRGGHAARPRLGLHPLHHPHRRRRLPRQGGHRQAQR